jgi:hypothetical protein
LDREFYIHHDGSIQYKRENKKKIFFKLFLFFLGSPFNVNVMDTQRVVVFGKGLGSIPVNIPTSFTILTQNAGLGELKCSIKGLVYIFFFHILVMVSSSRDIHFFFFLVFCFSNSI